MEVDGWFPLLPDISLPALTGEVLAEVVRRLPLVVWTGWVWREMNALRKGCPLEYDVHCGPVPALVQVFGSPAGCHAPVVC